MEGMEALRQHDRLQLIAEKRKWQTEIENKKRQLEDDRRALQHLKSKALRERWLLDGAPSAGPEQDQVRTQLQQDEARTRTLEDTISRLEQELVHLESGGCETITQTATVTSGPVEDVEVKGHSSPQQDKPAASVQVVQEVKGYQTRGMTKPRDMTEEMKRAMYSVEIKVERDRVTGETRVLSTNTTLPVDLSQQGVKVYEDEQKVVHEVNGEDGVQMLSSFEVEELIHKADEASMMSQTVATVTSLPTETQEAEAEAEAAAAIAPKPPPSVEITGMESKAGSEPSVDKASAENPVTMVFMGYQSVEDEDETKKVLGLQGTVKAELVVIDDGGDGKTSPGEKTSPVDQGGEAGPGGVQTAMAPPAASVPPASTKPPETAAVARNGETAGEAEGGAVQIKKEKQPCKCCSIM